MRTEFMHMDIRGDRPFDVVCVDEVDSMLIDGRSNSIQLSGPMPAMNHLELTLATIWSYIGQIERRLVTGLANMESQMFFVTEDFQVNKDRELVILSGGNLEECLIEVENGDAKAFIEKHTKTHLEKLLRDIDSQEKTEWDELKDVRPP